MKHYHNRNARDLSPLTAGQPVRIQDQTTKKWFPGTVSCVRPEPRLYEVQTQSGSILRPASTGQVAKSEDEPTNVDSDECQIETLHDVPDFPDAPVVPSPGTSETPSASHSSEIYRTRRGSAVVKPARLTE